MSRESVLYRDGFKCRACGWEAKTVKDRAKLRSHHIKAHGEMGDADYNRVLLCGTCHFKVHFCGMPCPEPNLCKSQEIEKTLAEKDKNRIIKDRSSVIVSVRLQDATIAHIKATKRMGVSAWAARLIEREAWRSHSKKQVPVVAEEYSRADFLSEPDL